MAALIVELDKHIGNAKAWRSMFGDSLPDLLFRRHRPLLLHNTACSSLVSPAPSSWSNP
jgi:hypothetical protein